MTGTIDVGGPLEGAGLDPHWMSISVVATVGDSALQDRIWEEEIVSSYPDLVQRLRRRALRRYVMTSAYSPDTAYEVSDAVSHEAESGMAQRDFDGNPVHRATVEEGPLPAGIG